MHTKASMPMTCSWLRHAWRSSGQTVRARRASALASACTQQPHRPHYMAASPASAAPLVVRDIAPAVSDRESASTGQPTASAAIWCPNTATAPGRRWATRGAKGQGCATGDLRTCIEKDPWAPGLAGSQRRQSRGRPPSHRRQSCTSCSVTMHHLTVLMPLPCHLPAPV